jgi:DNA-binding transcriptional LysR family regulator
VSDSEGDLSDEIDLAPLMDDPLYVALARSHPLADKPDLELADLRDETWIEGRGSTVANALRSAAALAGFEPKIVMESTQWLGKQGLVAAGLGITLIPTIVLDSVRDDIVLRSLASEGLRRQLYIATDDCRYQAPGVEPMKEILRGVAREHCFTCQALVV